MTERSSVDPLVAVLEDGRPAERLPRSWRGLIALAVVLSALSFVVAVIMFAVVHGQAAANCQKIHRVVVAGDRILDTPRNPLRRQNVRLWRSADCRP